MSFLSDYFDVGYEAGEQQVSCPFPHKLENEFEYLESNPSAHLNLEKNVFHCKACGTGANEIQFIKKILGCSTKDARKIQRHFTEANTGTKHEWDALQLTGESIELAKTLGISEQTLIDLNVKSIPNDTGLAFPIFMYDRLCDIRKYVPAKHNKFISRKGTCTGLVLPSDQWKEDRGTTLICAGEKDMAIARQHGFNAITITGGEQAIPKELNSFKQRHIVIVYDNDETGKIGARKLANELYNVSQTIKICTAFHKVCKEPKEDITDFFMKYKKTRQDLIKYIDESETFKPTTEKHEQATVSLTQASHAHNINKNTYSNIQVVAVSENAYYAPTALEFEKYKASGYQDTLEAGSLRDWELTERNLGDLLHLIDNNFTSEQIRKNQLSLAKISPKERCVKIQVLEKTTVYKAYVTDLFETSAEETKPMEYVAYCINCKLNSGEKYKVKYNLVPHPYKGNQLTMIVTEATKANDSVSEFVVNENTITHLQQIEQITGTVEQKIQHITEKIKGLLGYDGNNQLIQIMDLSFHTPLRFNFGAHFKNIRAYLDTIIISESRVGKSSTAETLRKCYALGAITSLAGNSCTIAGLVGGSNKTSGGFQTRAGLIPQNHQGLLIFEEFGKSAKNITTELTDIRSSNEVRISRISGTITLPAFVRMITLTNVKSSASIRSIASYPHGIAIVTELVHSAEDIARYDLIAIFSDKGNNQINPLWAPEPPFPKAVLQTRIRWIWSRSPKQIIINALVTEYIIKTSNELNTIFDAHIKIFGTETWKKLTRLSIAIAGYVVSTEETYTKILVLKEHVVAAKKILINLYDNRTFKLKEFVEHEKKFLTIDAEGIQALQNLYNLAPSVILHLEQVSEVHKSNLTATTGLDIQELNKVLGQLVRCWFIQFNGALVLPTERFREGLNHINRKSHIKKLGEL